MFCSNCGRTIRPDDAACAHCGAVIGQDRFEGGKYTAAQMRVEADAARSDADGRLTSYTRTSFMSYDNQPEHDVASGTTYRPALTDDEALNPKEPEAGEPEETAEAEADVPAEERIERREKPRSEPEPERAPFARAEMSEPEPAKAKDEPAEEAAEDVPFNVEIDKLAELKPLKRASIRPDVEERMQKFGERKQGGGFKLQLPTFIKKSEDPAEDVPGAEAADGVGKAEDDVAGEADAYFAAGEDDAFIEEEKTGLLARFGLTGKKLTNAIAATVLILAIVIGGVIWISYVASNRAKIAGVTYSVYDGGIKLLQSHLEETYRDSFTSTYIMNSTSGNALLSSDMGAINALLPDKPLENDQLFVATLTALQEAIGNAMKADANNTVNGLADNADAQAESAKRWQAIQAALTALSGATNATQLTSIVSDVDAAIQPAATIAPTSTPTSYSRLAKGMSDNIEVKRLQLRLINLGYLSGEADGDFGSMTETAIMAFQRQAGLMADGVADSATQTAIYADNAPAAPAATATPTPTGTDAVAPAAPQS